MNKFLKNIFLYMFLGIILLSVCVVAYDTNNLIGYYSFEQNASNYITDESSMNNNLLGLVNITQTTGKKGLGYVAVNNQLYSKNIGLHPTFSINTWISNSAVNNAQHVFTIGTTNGSDKLYGHIKGTYIFDLRSTVDFSGDNTVNSINQNISSPTSYHMVTYTFSRAINDSRIYVDGVLLNYTNQTDKARFTNQLLNFTIGQADIYNNGFVLDELSYWNVQLTPTDILILYNSGNGMNYTETVNDGATPIPNDEYLNICLPFNVLCHHAYYNDTVGMYCPIVEQERCVLECTDNLNYWYSRNQSPIDMNYQGNCTLINNECFVVGNRQCTGVSSTVSQLCFLDTDGVLRWKTVDYCSGVQTCVNGYCITAPQDENSDFLNGGGLSNGIKYILVLLIMVVTIIGFSVGGHTAQNTSLGFLMGIIFAVFELIIFTVLSWIPIWILITLIIFAVATIILISKSNMSSGSG